MMTFKRFLLLPASALLLAAGSAQADSLPLDRIDDVLAQGENVGFTHYEEIEAKGRDQVEIEGWLDDEWYADVRLSLDNGESLKEERERLTSGAWGMNGDDIRQALDMARGEGMVEFEEIQISQNGMIEIEGRDDSGRELEISLRQGSDSISGIDRD